MEEAAVPADLAPVHPANPTVAVPNEVAPTPAPAADLEVALAAEHLTKHQELFIRGKLFSGEFLSKEHFLDLRKERI